MTLKAITSRLVGFEDDGHWRVALWDGHDLASIEKMRWIEGKSVDALQYRVRST